MDSVALVKYKDSLYRTLSRGLNLLGGFGELVSPVLVKPNICTNKDGTGHSVTDPELVKTIIRMLLETNEELSVRIIESNSQSKNAQESFDFFGYTEYCEERQGEGSDVATTDLSNIPLAKVRFDGEYFNDPEIPVILTKPHYFISVAAAKTHYLSYITGALKNLFGVLPRKDMSVYHSKIHEVIADITRIVQPELSIVDARVGVEDWNGPTTHQIGAFILGRQSVSVDAVMTRVFQLNPNDVPHLKKLEGDNLGSIDATTIGVTIDDVKVKFSTPKVP
ncbi:MAG: DUF362 domain-containing protein [Candidatus Thorarchaeota archaeon]